MCFENDLCSTGLLNKQINLGDKSESGRGVPDPAFPLLFHSRSFSTPNTVSFPKSASRSKILANLAFRVTVKSRIPSKHFAFSRIPHCMLLLSRVPRIPFQTLRNLVVSVNRSLKNPFISVFIIRYEENSATPVCLMLIIHTSNRICFSLPHLNL